MEAEGESLVLLSDRVCGIRLTVWSISESGFNNLELEPKLRVAES